MDLKVTGVHPGQISTLFRRLMWKYGHQKSVPRYEAGGTLNKKNPTTGNNRKRYRTPSLAHQCLRIFSTSSFQVFILPLLDLYDFTCFGFSWHSSKTSGARLNNYNLGSMLWMLRRKATTYCCQEKRPGKLRFENTLVGTGRSVGLIALISKASCWWVLKTPAHLNFTDNCSRN